jgi:hypothetical protein
MMTSDRYDPVSRAFHRVTVLTVHTHRDRQTVRGETVGSAWPLRYFMPWPRLGTTSS